MNPQSAVDASSAPQPHANLQAKPQRSGIQPRPPSNAQHTSSPSFHEPEASDQSMSDRHTTHEAVKKRPRVSWAPRSPKSSQVKVAEDRIASPASRPDQTASQLVQPSQASKTRPDIPFPSRPRMQNTSERAAKDGRTAAREPQKETAIPGFFPWTGKHAEDKMTDQLIKGGFYDKAQLPNEGNSARSNPAAPQFKQKSSLCALSALFVAVLEQRQQRGLVTTPSTFKPPPRVTLTDAKREAWLRDLADETVPLRRLSRTIPHGIKGQILLHQCLSKQVPLPRAVWLAKCVGANEIRAFRRKGISEATAQEHEVKWVNEWTSIVASFVEAGLDKCGSPDGKPAAQYTLRLLLRLYAEDLLDRSQFLDWLLHRFETCSTNNVPIFLLLVRMFWTELLRGFKNGSRLARGLVQKLTELLNVPNKDAVAPLKQRVAEATYTLAATRPQCFLNASGWKNTERILLTLSASANPPLRTVFDSIISRNSRIGRSAIRDCLASKTHKRMLLDLLDGRTLVLANEQFLSKCFALCPDLAGFVTLLLHWATTAFREDSPRAYVAAQMIQRLRTRGLDTDTAILASLEHLRHEKNLHPRMLARVLNLLTQTTSFDVGAYLRRLVSTGALHSSRQQQPSWDAQILVNLDLRHASRSLVSLRQTLLRSARIHMEAVTELVDVIQQRIRESWPSSSPLDQGPLQHGHPLSSIPATMFLSANSCLSESILETAKGLFEPQSTSPECTSKVMSSSNTMTVGQFLWICNLFEQLESHAELAKFLNYAAQSCEAELISIITSVLELHLDLFVILGTATNIFEATVSRYRSLRATIPPAKDCALSLQRVAVLLHTDSSTTDYLANEIYLCNQGLGVAAFTPDSDSGAEPTTSNASLMDIDDDVERLMAQGANIDDQTFIHAFDKVMSKIAAMDHMSESQSNNVKLFLSRLRGADQEKLKPLAAQWLKIQLTNTNGTGLGRFIRALVEHGCLSLSEFVNIANKMYESWVDENASLAGKLAVETLDILVPQIRDATSTGVQMRYAFEVERQRFCDDNRRQVLRFLQRSLLVTAEVCGHATQTHLEALIESRPFFSIMQKLAIADYALIASELDFGSKMSIGERNNTCFLVTRLCDPLGSRQFPPRTIGPDAVDAIFSAADSLSLPFSLMALQFVFAQRRLDAGDAEADLVLLKTFGHLLSLEEDLMYELVAGLDEIVTRQLFALLEETLLAEQPLSMQLRNKLEASPLHELSKYHRIIDAVIPAKTLDIRLQVARRIVELSEALQAHYAQDGDARRDISTPWTDGVAGNVLQQWIRLLLRLSVIHTTNFRGGDADKAALTKLLTSLCTIMVDGVSQLTPETLEHVFDTVAYFVCDLSERELAQVRTSLRPPILQSPPVQFLLDHRDVANSWLHVTTTSNTSKQAQPSTDASNPFTTRQPPRHGCPLSTRPFHLRPWELFPDSTPNAGANDTALSLRLFRARVA